MPSDTDTACSCALSEALTASGRGSPAGSAAVFCLVAGHHWSLTVVLGLLFYILNNLVYALFKL